MQQTEKISSRKKFLMWSAGILTSLTAFKLFANSKKANSSQSDKKSETVKMLAQDGTLVEVDVDKLFCGKRKKITDEQLKKWVNKK